MRDGLDAIRNLLAEVLNVDDVFPTDLRAHADLCGLLHLLLHLLGQHVAQIDRLGVFPRPHQLHRPHKGQIVRDDLSQLGEMPAVPEEKT